MTFIEFFDINSIENLCACLTMLPEEVVLVGDNEGAMKRHIEDYKRLFEGRGQQVKFSYKKAFRWKVSQILSVLEQIVENYEDCVFGITGGDELIIFALGIICGKYADKNIQVHKISIRNNIVHDCDMDGKTLECRTAMLSVEENIQIYGGEIIYSDVHGEKTYCWDMNAEFASDIETMWNICKVNSKIWNKQIGVFETITKVGTTSEDGLTITANIADIKEYYKTHIGKYGINQELKDELCENGLLTYFDVSAGKVTLTYKNLQVKRCLTQAGQALEMKIYLTAKTLKDESGNNEYNDVMNGVEIDWDGIIRSGDQNYDTTNEIDVMLMHNMVPVFVSCKNGEVKTEELYKLNTVAERFGGKYAKKALVSTLLKNSPADKTLKQRAQDMGIQIIAGEDLMNDALLKKRLKNLWE